jgi:hypothetical protein
MLPLGTIIHHRKFHQKSILSITVSVAVALCVTKHNRLTISVAIALCASTFKIQEMRIAEERPCPQGIKHNKIELKD